MSVFTLIPASANLMKKPRVLPAAFGDGYVQRTNFGLNALGQTWVLTFDFGNSTAAHLPFINFLDALGGTQAFDWTPPGESASRRFVCADYYANTTPGYVWKCGATFVQDFGN